MRVRTAAEAAAWWATLLAIYTALVSAVSPTEVLAGAAFAAASAAAAVAARRTLLDSGHEPAPRGAGDIRGLTLRLPGRILADTARVLAPHPRGAWDHLHVGRDAARRGAVTLLLSASPGSYVTAVDPRRGVLTVHRLTRTPSSGRSSRRSAAGHHHGNGR